MMKMFTVVVAAMAMAVMKTAIFELRVTLTTVVAERIRHRYW